MTVDDNNTILEIKTALVEVKSDLKNLLDRLGNYVPASCIEHTTTITNLKAEIESLKGAFSKLQWALIGALGIGFLNALYLIFTHLLEKH